MFLADLLDACCRPYVSLFKMYWFGKYSLAFSNVYFNDLRFMGVLYLLSQKFLGIKWEMV